MLSGDTTVKLLDDLRFAEFVNILLQLVADISVEPIRLRVDPASPPDDDIGIVQDAVSLIVAALVARPKLLQDFYNYSSAGGEGKQVGFSKGKEGTSTAPGSGVQGIGGGIYEKERGRIEEFIVNMVMNHPVRKIRKSVANGFLRLCNHFAAQ